MAAQVITFGMSILLARILMPEDFGIMAIGMILVNYVNTFTDFGFTNALIQKDRITKDHINSVFCINFTISCFLTVVCFFSAPFISKQFNSTDAEAVIKALSAIFILSSFSSIYEAILKRELKHKFLSTVLIVETTGKYIIGITLALLGFNYYALVISQIAGVLIKILIYIFGTRWIPRLTYSHKHMKYIFNFGLWNFIRSQLYFINRYFLHITIAFYLNPASLGFFDKAYEMSRRPSGIFGKKINGVLLSGFSRLQEDDKGLQNWFFNLLVIQVIFFLPMYTGLYLVSPYIITSLLGEKWALSIEPMKIMCITFFFMTCSGGYASFNIGVGNYKPETLRFIFSSVLTIALSVPFTMLWGLEGACYALCIVSILGAILSFYLAQKRITIHYYSKIKKLALYGISSILMFSIVTAFLQILPAKTVSNLLIITSIGTFSYTFCIIASNLIYGRSMLFPISSLKK